MDRYPEHFSQDPELRQDVCSQESLDEFTIRVVDGLASEEVSTLVRIGEGLMTLDDDERQEQLFPLWKAQLDPEPTLNEMLYLSGITEKAVRYARMDQLHALFVEAAVEQGISPRRGSAS